MGEIDFEGLETELAGVKMRSPIGVGAIASATMFAKNAEEKAKLLLRGLEAGAGQVTVATIDYLPAENRERLSKLVWSEDTKHRAPPPIHPVAPWYGLKLESKYGLEGTLMYVPGLRMEPRDKEACEKDLGKTIKILKEKLPENVPIIGSVTGAGCLPEGWLPAVELAEEWGCDLIELNAACPIPSGFDEYVKWYLEENWPLRYPGAALLDCPEIMQRIIRETVKAVKVPVGVKLSPEIGFPRIVKLARIYRDAGAKYFTTLNCATTIYPPDIYNRGKPKVPYIDGNFFCGAQGPFLRVLNYKIVAAIKKFVPSVDVQAVGGITDPEHVVEFLMLGSNTVQQVLELMMSGVRIIKREIEFLKKFMKEQDYKNIKEFIGIHLQYIKGTELISGTKRIKIVIEHEPEKCTKCGICLEYPFCFANYEEGGAIKIDESRCAGCGNCVISCPAKARKMVIKELEG